MSRSDPQSEAALSLPAALPLQLGVEAGPVFAEPWQAQAFAMVVALHQRGWFTWPQWAAALTTELKAHGATDDGSRYYEHWVATLEHLLVAKQTTTHGQIDTVAAAWARAAEATPHGQPIQLANDPLSATAAS